MSLRYRKKLFYALVAVFFVLGIGVVLYVEGWRIDLVSFRVRKVGAIFIRSFPKDAEIYLDNKFAQNNSGFFQSGTLISGLFPKIYTIKLRANGYRPWQEEVAVSPSLVSEEKYAVLVPDGSVAAATGTIKNFWVIGGTLVSERNSGALIADGKQIGRGAILGATNDFGKIETLDGGIYYWNDAVDGKKINITAILKQAGLGAERDFKIIVDPYDKRRLAMIMPNAIKSLDAESGKLDAVAKSKNIITGFAAAQFLFAWTEWNAAQNTSTLVIYDKFLDKKLSSPPSFGGKTEKLAWIKNDELAILQDDGSLYTYDESSNELAKVADDVKQFAATSDGSAIAALEHKSLEVFLYNSDKDYYRFNLPEISEAEDIAWYGDMGHLFVIYPDRVRFLDFKDVALRNFTTVAETTRAQYDEKANRLYFLSAEGVEMIEFPR